MLSLFLFKNKLKIYVKIFGGLKYFLYLCIVINQLKIFIMKTKEIKLPVFGITITIDTDENNVAVSGVITSTDLKTEHEDEEDELYNAAIDGIESIILAHAMAGIDVTSPAYLEGIETSVNACANNF